MDFENGRYFMISAGLYEKNLITGEKGYNLAAIMLFGKDDVIRSCVSGYVTDAIYRVENIDRYDDRLLVRTNLIESYDRLMEFVAKHTSDKFCLVDNVSTSVRDVIAREVVSNILVQTVLRDVQEIKKKVFLVYDKKEALWKLK